MLQVMALNSGLEIYRLSSAPRQVYNAVHGGDGDYRSKYLVNIFFLTKYFPFFNNWHVL